MVYKGLPSYWVPTLSDGTPKKVSVLLLTTKNWIGGLEFYKQEEGGSFSDLFPTKKRRHHTSISGAHVYMSRSVLRLRRKPKPMVIPTLHYSVVTGGMMDGENKVHLFENVGKTITQSTISFVR